MENRIDSKSINGTIFLIDKIQGAKQMIPLKELLKFRLEYGDISNQKFADLHFSDAQGWASVLYSAWVINALLFSGFVAAILERSFSWGASLFTLCIFCCISALIARKKRNHHLMICEVFCQREQLSTLMKDAGIDHL
jgi:hypothetical protein